jgi:cell division transport system permease protein
MSLRYVIREGFAGFKRAKLASFTSIFSLFVAVFLLGVLGRIGFNAYKVALALRHSIDVEVFLDDMSKSKTTDLQDKIKDEKLVSQVNYISKDSAAVIFKKQFGSGGASLADLKFLPASFRVKMAKDATISHVDSLVNVFKSYSGVQSVRFNQKLLQVIESRFHTVTWIGAVLAAIILLASVILVFNTIRLTIYAKRKLIRAMKLVGATNAFIRRPFVMEGIFQGIIAGILAVVVMVIVFKLVLASYIPQVGILAWPLGHWYYLSGLMIVLAILLGLFGSHLAARRFIRKTSITE